MKRLAKLQASASTFPTPSTPSSSSQVPSPVPSPKPKASPSPAPKPAVAPTPAQIPQKRKAPIGPPPFSYDVWENETIAQVFLVTLDVRPPTSPGRLFLWLLNLGQQPAESMKNDFEYVWLRSAVDNESSSEGRLDLYCIWSRFPMNVVCTGNLCLNGDNLESVLITRLELDPLSPE
jgi:hypothetical protein